MSTPAQRPTRRALLATGTALLVGVAGCAESSDPTPTDAGRSQSPSGGVVGAPGGGASDGETDGGTGDTGANADTDTATGTPEPTGGRTTPDLDLREANVTAVEFEGVDGSYDFAVTLYHDDDGEDGYANWWQVESLDGDQLGRRELPSGATCVVVRGHDQTHAYGGRAMLVNLDSGATRAIDQGPDSQTFDADDCP